MRRRRSTRVIKGAKTRVKNPTGLSSTSRTGNVRWEHGQFRATVYPITREWRCRALRMIRGGPAQVGRVMIGTPGAVGYDSSATDSGPELSGPSADCGICQVANGAQTPARRIYGQTSMLSRTMPTSGTTRRRRCPCAESILECQSSFPGRARAAEAQPHIQDQIRVKQSGPLAIDVVHRENLRARRGNVGLPTLWRW